MHSLHVSPEGHSWLRGHTCSHLLPPRGAESRQCSGLRSAPGGESVDGKGVALEEKCGGHPCPDNEGHGDVTYVRAPLTGGDVVSEVSFLRPRVPSQHEDHRGTSSGPALTQEAGGQGDVTTKATWDPELTGTREDAGKAGDVGIRAAVGLLMLTRAPGEGALTSGEVGHRVP